MLQVTSTTSTSSQQDLECLLREAHVISLHCPLSPATLGLIGQKELEMMRPGVLLVNYSRGEVINEEVNKWNKNPQAKKLCECKRMNKP